MSDYQVVVTAATQNAILEARLAGLSVGGGGGLGSPNVVSLEQYGSFAAGVADPTLDGPAFTAAITALRGMGGGTLEMFHNYSISTPLTFVGDDLGNIALNGRTPTAALTHTTDQASAGDNGIVTFKGATPYGLKNFRVTGVSFFGHSTSDQCRSIEFSACDHVYLDRCRFSTTAAEGLYFSGQNTCKNVFVTDCRADNVGVGAQKLSAYNLNVDTSLLAGCKAISCGQGSEQDGRNARFLGNHFENITVWGILCLSTWASWIDTDGVTVLSSNNVLIQGNTFISCGAAIGTGDSTGHVTGGITVPGNQGRLLISENTVILCSEFFAGGADSGQVVIIENNLLDDSPDGNNYCINALKGHFVIRGNTFHLGATHAWAGLVRIGDTDPVHTSGIVKDNVIDGKCWTTNMMVLGPEVTLGHNDILNVPVTNSVYYAFAGTLLTTDGAISSWSYVSDTWMPQSDPDFYYSPTQPSRIRTINVPPPKGNWKVGDRADNIAGSGTLGWRCIVAGTADTIKTGVTATTTNGSPSVTFAGASKITKYQWITIAGMSGRYQITALDPTTGAGTIAPVAAATVSGAAVAYSAPTWEVTGTLVTRAISGTATVTPQDQLLSYSTTGAAFTATLPPVVQSEGHIVRFAKSDASANALTVAADPGDGNAINGAATFSPVATQYQLTHFTCIGGAWYAHDDGASSGGGGGGAVSTVFGRAGAVTAQSNDYSYAQLSGKPSTIAGISSGVAADLITQVQSIGDARYIQIGEAIPDSEITDSPYFTITSPGATPSAVWTAAHRQQVMTLTANATVTISAIPAGGSLLLRVIQASSGSPYTLAHAVSGLGTLFPDNGSTPTMSTGAGKFDDYLYRYDGTRTVYARVLTSAG